MEREENSSGSDSNHKVLEEEVEVNIGGKFLKKHFTVKVRKSEYLILIEEV